MFKVGDKVKLTPEAVEFFKDEWSWCRQYIADEFVVAQTNVNRRLGFHYEEERRWTAEIYDLIIRMSFSDGGYTTLYAKSSHLELPKGQLKLPFKWGG